MTTLPWPRLISTADNEPTPVRQYLLVSDFDHTLTFDDSGLVLSQMLGATDFERKIAGLARINLVQQGGELTYLLLHDPEYRKVRREHLIEVGKRIRLKYNLDRLVKILDHGIEGHQFRFYVISAAPEEVIQSALEGIVPPERIYGTRLCYNERTGEIESGQHVSAGYGKVAALAELQANLGLACDRVVYVGDGNSDVHAMLHINRLDGYTIAVSEGTAVGPIARRTILCDDALGMLVPILEDIVGWRDPLRVRALFEQHGVRIHAWDKVQTDAITVCEEAPRA